MKNRNILYVLVLLMITGSLSSCKKYLDKKSSTGTITPETLSDLQGILDDGLYMNQKSTPASNEASANDFFLLQADFDNRNTWHQNVYKWVPDDINQSYPNDWSSAYLIVYNSNFCLEMLNNIPVTSTNKTAWNNVKGSSLFYRSFSFWQLVSTYSKAYDETTSSTDLGIPLRQSSDFNIPTVRASVKDSYERIINDTKEAANYLADIPPHPYRPSKAAAYGLLARTYLSMRKYDSAWKYSDLCLQIKNQLVNFNGDPDFLGTGATFPIKQFNKETIFYSEMTNYVLTGVTGNIAKIDTLLYTSYTANDIRKAAFFTATGIYQKFKGDYSATTVHFTGLATDEMFLIRAECNARKGDKTAALNDLNTLLAKRYDGTFVQVTAADANGALVRILIERRKELLMRGIRFSDIKRLNKEGANINSIRIISGQTFTLPPNDNRFALPIPKDVIDQSGIPQNPQ